MNLMVLGYEFFLFDMMVISPLNIIQKVNI